jgi:ABC-type uncharacterized transport system substrate-binding protein
MRRRDLIAGVAATAAAWPLAARAQQKAMPVIGFLGSVSPGASAPVVAAFRQGLSETGYVEGQNLAIEFRWAEGSYDRLPGLAADLVSRKVDVITTSGTPPARAAKNATSTIPIVFTGVGDPVELGLVASLARPGGNLTGFSFLTVELVPKRLELLAELVPQAKVIALLVNPANTSSERVIRGTEEAARAKGVQLPILKASTESEIDIAFSSLAQLHAGALVIGNDPLFTSRREQLVALASRYAVPAIERWREFATAGGPDQLWTKLHSCLSPSGRLRWKDPEGRETGRPAGTAAYHIRVGHQPQDRQGARPHRAAIPPRPRRRGHRITAPRHDPHPPVALATGPPSPAMRERVREAPFLPSPALRERVTTALAVDG